ncbi:hypothetical protein, partial [Nostoc sp. UHCC 0251]|uniref:hypothetical protein n=1 Tax=Nostoc sp. UHCC 0251 TaxID=3110240 RepID=UPI002B200F4D
SCFVAPIKYGVESPTKHWTFCPLPPASCLLQSLQDLRIRIQQLFEQLTFEQVMSISSYNFILEALFYAASY